jgi:hypothetical protein
MDRRRFLLIRSIMLELLADEPALAEAYHRAG